jgi:uncharacterized coiled-coil protein SlyX
MGWCGCDSDGGVAMNDRIYELELKIDHLERNIEVLEGNITKLAEVLSNQSHFLHMVARQLKYVSQEMDIDINPPRYN